MKQNKLLSRFLFANEDFYFTFIIYTISFLIIGINLIPEGMFLDGLTYSSVARNLANSSDNLWHLQYTQTLYTHFYEHPPLGFWLQALLFKIFGDSIYIERIYSFLTFILTITGISLIWKEISPGKTIRKHWIPVLFLILMPTISWSFSNNLLENTMVVFLLLSIYFLIKNFFSNKLIWIALAALFIFLAFMTKGFVALFPFSIYFWIYLFNKNYTFKQFLKNTSLLFVSFLILVSFMLLISRDGINYFTTYINNQVLRSLTEVQNVPERWNILFKLFSELAIPIIIVIILLLVNRKNFRPLNNWFYILISLGLSASLPIIISLKQSRFYLLPSLVFFAIAFALIAYPPITKFLEKSMKKKLKTSLIFFSFIILISSTIVIFNQFGKVNRDVILVHDVKKIVEKIPQGLVIGIDENLNSNWKLHAYFARYGNISLDYSNSKNNLYYLSQKNDLDTCLYHKVKIHSERFFLYKLNREE